MAARKQELIEVGGELYGYGRKADGTPWRVLVESSPDEEADAEGLEPRVLALDGLAVATSGDRWHAYSQDGRRYSHTIDPRSGEPVTDAAAAVTVVAADAMHADAWATALTVMGAGKPGASNETVNDPVEISEWMRDACRAIAD